MWPAIRSTPAVLLAFALAPAVLVVVGHVLEALLRRTARGWSAVVASPALLALTGPSPVDILAATAVPIIATTCWISRVHDSTGVSSVTTLAASRHIIDPLGYRSPTDDGDDSTDQ